MNDLELTCILGAIYGDRRRRPEARLVRQQLLAIDLDGVPYRRWHWPEVKGGSRSMLVAARFITASLVLALFGTFLYSGLVMRAPDVSAPPAAVSSASPTESISSAEVSPSAAPRPDGSRIATRVPQTRQLVAFDPGVDPIDLAVSPTGALYYVDAGTGIVKVDTDGYQTLVVDASEPDRSAEVTPGARLVASDLDAVAFIREDGSAWVFEGTSGRFYLKSLDDHRKSAEVERSNGPTVQFASVPIAAAAVGHDVDTFQLFTIDATSPRIMVSGRQYSTSLRPVKPYATLRGDGLGPARDLFADDGVYVLYRGAVQRYRDGRLDPAFKTDLGGLAPDLGIITGTPGIAGRIYVYDAAGRRALVLSEDDGRLLEAWAPGAGDPAMDDVRGMVALAGSDGGSPTLAWITPSGLYESILGTGTASGRSGLDRSASPAGAEGEAPVIDVGTSSVRLQADALRIEGSGQVFRGVPDPGTSLKAEVGAGVGRRFLDIRWREHGHPMLLTAQLAGDGSSWWVTQISTYDGTGRRRLVYYHELDGMTRTPVGEALEGNLRLDADEARNGARLPVRLSIDGLRLMAFEPGTGPAPLTGCNPVPEDLDEEAMREAIVGKPIAEAESYLRPTGYCREYHYFHRLPSSDVGVSERWCVAPPSGEVSFATRGFGGVLLVQVDDDKLVAAEREQPPAGWGCPLDDGTISPLPDPLVPAAASPAGERQGAGSSRPDLAS
jgi:hypothetical protein